MVGLLVGFFAGFLFCIPLVYSSGASLLFFWSIYCFLPIKKKVTHSCKLTSCEMQMSAGLAW